MDHCGFPCSFQALLLVQVLEAVTFVVVEKFEVVDFQLMGCRAM
jgi:hypothetical protein